MAGGRVKKRERGRLASEMRRNEKGKYFQSDTVTDNHSLSNVFLSLSPQSEMSVARAVMTSEDEEER